MTAGPRAPWSQGDVVARLEEAARTLRALPAPAEWANLGRLGSSLPAPIRSAAEAYGYDKARPRPARPSPAAIDRMEQAIGWLLWLDPADQRLVWARASGIPWKRIALERGEERTTTWRAWTIATFRIVAVLNRARAA